MNVFEFVFLVLFSLFESRFVFGKNMEYLTFIHIREEKGIMNLFKSFLSVVTNYLIIILLMMH